MASLQCIFYTSGSITLAKNPESSIATAWFMASVSGLVEARSLSSALLLLLLKRSEWSLFRASSTVVRASAPGRLVIIG